MMIRVKSGVTSAMRRRLSMSAHLLRSLPVIALLTLMPGTAFALGTGASESVALHTMVAQQTSYIQSGAMAPVRPMLSAPDDLPALVSGATGPVTKQLHTELSSQHALERQIFWRYSNHTMDLSPWYRAEQSKKHAALTGPSQLLIMLLAFAFMSAVTVALWRQMASIVPQQRKHISPPRRLN